MLHLFVTIPIAETWPTPEDLASRDAAVDALTAAKVGNCRGAGGGMGEMDFSFQVSDESFARSETHRVMSQFFAGREYRVTVSD
jgi:hypothetical protein